MSQAIIKCELVIAATTNYLQARKQYLAAERLKYAEAELAIKRTWRDAWHRRPKILTLEDAYKKLEQAPGGHPYNRFYWNTHHSNGEMKRLRDLAELAQRSDSKFILVSPEHAELLVRFSFSNEPYDEYFAHHK